MSGLVSGGLTGARGPCPEHGPGVWADCRLFSCTSQEQGSSPGEHGKAGHVPGSAPDRAHKRWNRPLTHFPSRCSHTPPRGLDSAAAGLGRGFLCASPEVQVLLGAVPSPGLSCSGSPAAAPWSRSGSARLSTPARSSSEDSEASCHPLLCSLSEGFRETGAAGRNGDRGPCRKSPS